VYGASGKTSSSREPIYLSYVKTLTPNGAFMLHEAFNAQFTKARNPYQAFVPYVHPEQDDVEQKRCAQ
jgi:hypothetical protein